MVNYIYIFLMYFLSTEFFVASWFILIDLLFFKNFFIFIFFLFFIINFYYIKNEEKSNFNIDIFYKYFLILIKTPNFFSIHILNTFKKIYVFTVHFKYKIQRTTYSILINNFTRKYFIIWRPLFKKFSYFGYYRSNRSKWIK